MACVYGSITVQITKTRNRKHESITVDAESFAVDSTRVNVDGVMEHERVQLNYRGRAFDGVAKFTLRASYDVLGTTLFSRSVYVDEVSRGFVAAIDEDLETLHVEGSRVPSSAN